MLSFYLKYYCFYMNSLCQGGVSLPTPMNRPDFPFHSTWNLLHIATGNKPFNFL